MVDEKGEKEEGSLGETSSKCRGGQSVKLPALGERTTPMARRTDPHEDGLGIGTLNIVRCIRLSTCSKTL